MHRILWDLHDDRAPGRKQIAGAYVFSDRPSANCFDVGADRAPARPRPDDPQFSFEFLREHFACAGSRTSAAESLRFASGEREEHMARSEEHTSELQSRLHLVCRLLLEKKKTPTK